jgi:RNA polymerase sigma factor (TIGR02999 family)
MGPANADNLSTEPTTPAVDGAATPELFDRVYGELRDIARNQMSRERAGHTLQTTALVHEAYLRLMRSPDSSWSDPKQFFAAAAVAMRRILIERARRYARAPDRDRGGRKRIPFSEGEHDGPVELVSAGDEDSAHAMLDLDVALDELKTHDAPACEVVMLRFFAGLSVEETAVATGRSPRSVKRDWAFARGWLSNRLQPTA